MNKFLSTSSFIFDNTFIFKIKEVILILKATYFIYLITDSVLDNELTLKSNLINIYFELIENCIFEINKNNRESLKWKLNMEKYININEFSFKTSEIKQNDKEIKKYNLLNLMKYF